MVRNEGTEKSALKGGVCRADSRLCAPVPVSLNECCALVLLRGQQTQGEEFFSRTGIFVTAWYCLGQQAIL